MIHHTLPLSLQRSLRKKRTTRRVLASAGTRSEMKSLTRTQRLARTGAAMVEFAIIANVMFLLVLSCIEFARMNMVRNLAQDAAYYGARQAMVPGATAEEAQTVAEDIMSSMLPSGYEVTVETVNSDSIEVEVHVRVSLHEVALLTPLFLPDTTIGATAKMRTERYQGFFQPD